MLSQEQGSAWNREGAWHPYPVIRIYLTGSSVSSAYTIFGYFWPFWRILKPYASAIFSVIKKSYIIRTELHRSDSTAQKYLFYSCYLLRVVFALITKPVTLFSHTHSAYFVQKERIWGEQQGFLNYSKRHLHMPILKSTGSPHKSFFRMKKIWAIKISINQWQCARREDASLTLVSGWNVTAGN